MRDINYKRRNSDYKTRRISLDATKNDGRLKNPKSDISDVWLTQKNFAKDAGTSFSEKIRTIKKNIITRYSEHKKQIKKTKLVDIPTTIKRNKKATFIIGSGLIVLLMINNVLFMKRDPKVSTETLGEQDFSTEKLPEEKPDFAILVPGSKKLQDLNLKRVSPQGTAATFVYVDEVDRVQINVSQQELPERLKTNQDQELEKIAKDFQASNIIQIDEMKVYHGYSEKGNKQSLVFIKENSFVLIAALGKVSDDAWVGYITSLHY